MPYLTIQTNKDFDRNTSGQLLKQASKAVAEVLGKPESYVMVALPPAIPMVFAGSDDSLAYLELKSIGLPQEATASISDALCSLVNESLGIAKNRIYIEFSNAERSMWGWDGRTF